MLQVKNETPFVSSLFVFPDEDGVDTLYVAVKGTFELARDGLRVAEEQQPIVPADEHWGKPGESSLKYAGEAHLLKPATDVVLVGDAHAPGGRPAPHFAVSFSVGPLKKHVLVFGDRTWKGDSPTPPIPAARVPLRFERAFGGRHPVGKDGFAAEMRNPVGVGFRGKRKDSELNGTPLPNLEHPKHPVSSRSDKPPPHGVGYIAPGWEPRIAYAGTYDEAWRKKRAPYLPRDFDPRFFQAAPPDQIYPGHLRGGEPVELINASPAGIQRFRLPAVELQATVRIAHRQEEPPLRVETLLFEADEDRFCLLWRGAVRCDKKALKVEEVAVQVKSMTGVVE